MTSNRAQQNKTPGDQDAQLNREGREEQASMDPGKLDEAVRRGDTDAKRDETRGRLTRVDITGAGDPVENQVIGDMTFGRDANGKVAFVDFGGIESTPHYAGE